MENPLRAMRTIAGTAIRNHPYEIVLAVIGGSIAAYLKFDSGLIVQASLFTGGVYHAGRDLQRSR